MKKNIVVLITIVLLFSCNDSNNKKVNNDWKIMKLKGKVKSITENKYRITKHNDAFQKGEVFNRRIYNFNTAGNLIEIIGDPSMASGSWAKQEFKYNEKEEKIEWTIYNDDGSLQGRANYKHDPEGNIIEENIYSQNFPKQGELIYQGKNVHTYDNNRNKIQTIRFSNEGKQGSIITYAYDKDGNLIEEKDGGHLITNKYDSKGNIVETTMEGTTMIKYTYDKNDNWIEQVFDSGDREGSGIIGREITYY